MSFVIKLQEIIMYYDFFDNSDILEHKVVIRKRHSVLPRLVINPNQKNGDYIWVEESSEYEDVVFDSEELAKSYIISLDEFKTLSGDEFTKKRLEYYFIPA
ncbi:MAG: hypothetical protein Q8K30_05820 [Candidatus Gracilibacteria bacterium]|nr:hypothetical protein [Candidatus Gracilibacteria bacterium]